MNDDKIHPISLLDMCRTVILEGASSLAWGEGFIHIHF